MRQARSCKSASSSSCLATSRSVVATKLDFCEAISRRALALSRFEYGVICRSVLVVSLTIEMPKAAGQLHNPC